MAVTSRASSSSTVELTPPSTGAAIAANASRTANRGYEQIAREMMAEAAEIDRREDELYGEARGDELPERLRTSAARRATLREARQELERERAAEDDAGTLTEAPEAQGDPGAVIVEAAKDADLVIVGTRGLNPVQRILLGSVSSKVVHRADCDVLVVR